MLLWLNPSVKSLSPASMTQQQDPRLYFVTVRGWQVAIELYSVIDTTHQLVHIMYYILY